MISFLLWFFGRQVSKPDPPQLPPDQCITCHFYRQGQCRSNRPDTDIIVYTNGEGMRDWYSVSYWPNVQPTDWCGEWEAMSK